uniref:Uncharacterized protein n=1 Tax=Chromera velia CCMP2878 TaxID=1169474 RepID=A0A0G4HCC1_9ALVE|eukprot:Cvel_26030.t1-p1 / transcript=Cvel_26030.t1 / gene=Cvel_26030 / organism=Chromera_velia_CCMP2878 / gene_product=hypothetical protein / transcript_product=hypothetical protein / location=Cvel_scaffold3032:15459-19532(-) / protein_length=906 / sequence_SO=supercontig / SO=protein_coding / is_pseudo=false
MLRQQLNPADLPAAGAYRPRSLPPRETLTRAVTTEHFYPTRDEFEASGGKKWMQLTKSTTKLLQHTGTEGCTERPSWDTDRNGDLRESEHTQSEGNDRTLSPKKQRFQTSSAHDTRSLGDQELEPPSPYKTGRGEVIPASALHKPAPLSPLQATTEHASRLAQYPDTPRGRQRNWGLHLSRSHWAPELSASRMTPKGTFTGGDHADRHYSLSGRLDEQANPLPVPIRLWVDHPHCVCGVEGTAPPLTAPGGVKRWLLPADQNMVGPLDGWRWFQSFADLQPENSDSKKADKEAPEADAHEGPGVPSSPLMKSQKSLRDTRHGMRKVATLAGTDVRQTLEIGRTGGMGMHGVPRRLNPRIIELLRKGTQPESLAPSASEHTLKLQDPPSEAIPVYPDVPSPQNANSSSTASRTHPAPIPPSLPAPPAEVQQPSVPSLPSGGHTGLSGTGGVKENTTNLPCTASGYVHPEARWASPPPCHLFFGNSAEFPSTHAQRRSSQLQRSPTAPGVLSSPSLPLSVQINNRASQAMPPSNSKSSKETNQNGGLSMTLDPKRFSGKGSSFFAAGDPLFRTCCRERKDGRSWGAKETTVFLTEPEGGVDTSPPIRSLQNTNLELNTKIKGIHHTLPKNCLPTANDGPLPYADGESNHPEALTHHQNSNFKPGASLSLWRTRPGDGPPERVGDSTKFRRTWQGPSKTENAEKDRPAGVGDNGYNTSQRLDAFKNVVEPRNGIIDQNIEQQYMHAHRKRLPPATLKAASKETGWAAHFLSRALSSPQLQEAVAPGPVGLAASLQRSQDRDRHAGGTHAGALLRGGEGPGRSSSGSGGGKATMTASQGFQVLSQVLGGPDPLTHTIRNVKAASKRYAKLKTEERRALTQWQNPNPTRKQSVSGALQQKKTPTWKPAGKG